MNRHNKKVAFIAATTLFISVALYQLGTVIYIFAKAELAQHLIANAWEKTETQGMHIKPWPWADTWPVARLQYGDDNEEDLYILAGATGSSLAFGPGQMLGTADPGEAGASIIGGHRDTHFSFLQHLEVGEIVRVQTIEKVWKEYKITNIEIHNINDGPLMLWEEQNQLVLVTCFPFTSLLPESPMRYVVTAEFLEWEGENVGRSIGVLDNVAIASAKN